MLAAALGALFGAFKILTLIVGIIFGNEPLFLGIEPPCEQDEAIGRQAIMVSGEERCYQCERQNDKGPLFNPVWWIGVVIGVAGILIALWPPGIGGGKLRMALGIAAMTAGFFIGVLAVGWTP